MKNPVAVIIAIAVLIASLSIAYYFVVFLPSKEKAKQELELKKIQAEQDFKREQAKDREMKISQCLDEAYISFSHDWDNTCELQGKEKECSLPSYISDNLNERYEKNKRECIERYPSD